MDFNQREDLNGIRFSWNVWPTNRIDAVTCSVPIGCLYTPLKQIPDRTPLQYEPVLCRNCRCVLNSYSHVDFNTKVWTCPICQGRNPLPQSYHQMTETNLPAELHPDYTTVEYELQRTTDSRSHPPIFLFVVDTCTTEKEFQPLKDLLLQVVALLPSDAYVGFITYGNYVYVHELNFSEFSRSYVFSGNKTYEPSALQQMLNLTRQVEDSTNPFIMTVDSAELMLNTVIEKMERDTSNTDHSIRSPRCTGTALHIATTLLSCLYPTTGGQIILLSSGPITKGPGTMATPKVIEPIRQHSDIEKDKAPLTTSAVQFFTELGNKASESNIVINYIPASFEETGIYEMEPCILKTGGWMQSCESWTDSNIIETFEKFFTTIYEVAGNDCTLSVNFTKNFKLSGCIGPCSSLNHSNDMVSEKVIGNGGTTEWKLCGLLPSTTLAFFIEIAASKADPIPSGSTAFIQFVTKYRHFMTGTYRIRVTTVAIRFNDLATGSHLIAQSFDQEAATVILARYAMWKVRNEDLVDVVHSLDRTLIRFCRKFGTYNKGDPTSFSLGSSFSVFPQFMYHFRRSPFMSTFNFSPDNTTSLRHALLTEDMTNSLFMIQPTLMQYTLDNSPRAVVLDVSNLQRNCVLLLDTYFRVLVWHGKDIAAWRNAGYQNQPEYANLKAILEEPLEEAKALISERFPTPLLVKCDQDSGLERYLLVRCVPSSSSSYDGGFRGADSLGTDEPSFASFSMKLKQVAVND
ncbi:Sec23/Sec24 trunk domain containing protein [Histomonas meleagridis]|uniref:Sec23/Sec24 trunk domain containing protein n=1 Tax=Histomonas meleagridis TaxID=135588 RepID=UPI0035593E41|nr:Sec23/Sec24 trunk domain containing protein [Histomonas meleagridis]KAH0801400.1 Sec23/Sec24 trunk domain containing protein [Histomonas meleagridis]